MSIYARGYRTVRTNIYNKMCLSLRVRHFPQVNIDCLSPAETQPLNSVYTKTPSQTQTGARVVMALLFPPLFLPRAMGLILSIIR